MKWKRATVQANGINVFYTRTGGDKPVLIMNHGATDNGLCWMPVAKQLEADFDVIMPDARGHGKSSTAAGEYGVVQRAEDLISFIKVLALENPIIMGHSMGAQTSLFTAAKYPENIRAVILEDPVLIDAEDGVFSGHDNQDVRKMMAENARKSKHSPRMALRSFGKNKLGWPEDELRHWANAKKQLSNDFIESLGKYRDDPDPWDALARVIAPVLLITGEKAKGGIVSEGAARKAITMHDQLQVAHFDTGHNVRREDFAGYMAAVRNFLQTVV